MDGGVADSVATAAAVGVGGLAIRTPTVAKEPSGGSAGTAPEGSGATRTSTEAPRPETV